jgi:superfamily II DNA or RNA helicase
MSALTEVQELAPWQLEMYVTADIDRVATPEQLAVLQANALEWRSTLARLLRDSDDALQHARSLTGEERHQVLADLEAEHRRIRAAWARLVPSAAGDTDDDDSSNSHDDSDDSVDDTLPAITQLQASWEPGRVVVWAAGPNAPIADGPSIKAMLAATGAPDAGWSAHTSVQLPDGRTADSLSIPVREVLGWLVAAGADQLDEEQLDGDTGIAPSLRWLGGVALWAVELTARGSMVPQLRRRTRRGTTRSSSGSYSVRWTPALVDPVRLLQTAEGMPGAVLALDRKVDRRALTRSALTGMVDAICRTAASTVTVQAPPPHVRSASEVAEAFLGRLDGSAFDAPTTTTDKIVAAVERWARAVTTQYGHHGQIVVQLDPPDESDAWRLRVFTPGDLGELIPIAQSIVTPSPEREHYEDELARVERMVPALIRTSANHRGDVIVSSDEAWNLMSSIGAQLATAGFDVRVPALSSKRATPTLRVYADASEETVVGANQLADVTWSAVFGDVELTAAEVARMAKEARPLIHSGGRWVAIDRADLQAVAAALDERAATKQMTGAEMLRLALGLDETPHSFGVSLAGGGWAADLLRAANRVSEEPARAPKGFVGELRSYQAEALAWLGFLDDAGLGGCLALDMGLGKTPTMLAHLLAGVDDGPALVVAPPAVIGNWMAEAARFTPSLRAVVHHGINRAAPRQFAKEVAHADVVVTTYGTALRDIDALADVKWSRLVLDEAQAIKNPSNDTSQQLRTIDARSKVALTGTPIENGIGDLWAILDFANPGLVGTRSQFMAGVSGEGRVTRAQGEDAMRALNGILVFRRTKAEPEIAAELPDQIDELDHCAMTREQIALYQALLDTIVTGAKEEGEEPRKGQILAAITALKQICNHPWAYNQDDRALEGRSGKLARLEEIVDSVFAADEKVLIFTHFATWGRKLAQYLTERMGVPIECYDGSLARGARDAMIERFQSREGAGALVLSLKAGGTGLNLTAASHVVLYDRWWNPAVEDQARDRAWRIGQTRTVICHRLVCTGTVDERVEEVVAGKRQIADLVLPKSSSLADLDSAQLQAVLGLRPDQLLTAEDDTTSDKVPA